MHNEDVQRLIRNYLCFKVGETLEAWWQENNSQFQDFCLATLTKDTDLWKKATEQVADHVAGKIVEDINSSDSAGAVLIATFSDRM